MGVAQVHRQTREDEEEGERRHSSAMRLRGARPLEILWLFGLFLINFLSLVFGFVSSFRPLSYSPGNQTSLLPFPKFLSGKFLL